MFKRILVPLDGSAYAAQAVPIAARIARASGAAVQLVCVFDVATTFGSAMGPVPLPQSTIDDQYALLRAHLQAVASHRELAGLSVDTEVLTGRVAVMLLNAIDTGHVDLVVMNSHGHGGVVRWLLGSVAEHVVHYATVPLFVIRQGPGAEASADRASDTSWQALVGLDGSAFGEEALAPTVQVLQALNEAGRGRLNLVRVEHPFSDADDLEPVLGSPEQQRAAHELALREADTALAAVAQRLRAHYPALEIAYTVVEARDPAGALIDVAGRLASEPQGAESAPRGVLIGLATHGRSGLARWTLGSVAARVLEGSHVPLLVIRPRAIAQEQRPTREQIVQS